MPLADLGARDFFSFLIHDTCSLQQSWTVMCEVPREKKLGSFTILVILRRDLTEARVINGQQKLIHKFYIQLLTNFFSISLFPVP